MIETGLSDFHMMTVTVIKTTYEKLKPKVVNYRDYKIFCNDTFRQILLEKLNTENINTNCGGFEKFLQICIDTLNMFAPFKEKTHKEIICLKKSSHEKEKVKEYIREKTKLIPIESLISNNATTVCPFCGKLKKILTQI